MGSAMERPTRLKALNIIDNKTHEGIRGRSCHVALTPRQIRLMERELDEGESKPSVQHLQFLTSLMHNYFTLLLPTFSNLQSYWAPSICASQTNLHQRLTFFRAGQIYPRTKLQTCVC